MCLPKEFLRCLYVRKHCSVLLEGPWQLLSETGNAEGWLAPHTSEQRNQKTPFYTPAPRSSQLQSKLLRGVCSLLRDPALFFVLLCIHLGLCYMFLKVLDQSILARTIDQGKLEIK